MIITLPSMMLRLSLALALASLLLSPLVSSHKVPSNIKWWCSQTPNPKPCEYFMSQKPSCHSVKQKSDFYKMSVEIALERALNAAIHTIGLGPKCRNAMERAAWADCLQLYEHTILKLNKTIDQNGKCSEDDSQTWLSAALTNLDTCRTGFMELGVPDYMLPLMSNNVSMLICNTLATNYKPKQHKEHNYNDGYPIWVSPGDRKLLQATSPTQRPNLVVAQDGSGNFKTIQQAVNAASKRSGKSGRFVIYVKAGTYKENVVVGTKMKNIMLVGDGIGRTIITGSRSVGGGATTYNSATLAVDGDGFIGRGLTIRNTAGPQNHQAVALRSGADLSVFYKCSFEGYQDTLYVHSQRQFFRECDIYGTVDFIFGNAAVVLQSCNIFARRPLSKQKITITAQGRSDPNENTGISIHNSRVTAAPDLKAVQKSFQSFLGRPWRKYSRTVFMTTFLDSIIAPPGWLEWSGTFALDTLYYAEYMNTGPGSSTANRVKWRGYRGKIATAEASKFTVGNFIVGNSWLPSTQVPFTSSL
ncbi:hypothetical protein Sjap_020459 [Stephania japonica]|uniref:Pectinesterase n=1 Tax=Stephania japonica TaxID=461633 RepID=A0AAP0F3E9_9MAGN